MLQRKYNKEMRLTLNSISPDIIGASASGLCLIHCIATPFIFVAKACTATASCCSEAPLWWRAVDYLFIVVSFMAIYYSTKNSSKKWVVNAMWVSWALLVLVVIGESFLGESFLGGSIPTLIMYLPAFSIIGLHFYNMRYCKCSTDSCCVQ